MTRRRVILGSFFTLFLKVEKIRPTFCTSTRSCTRVEYLAQVLSLSQYRRQAALLRSFSERFFLFPFVRGQRFEKSFGTGPVPFQASFTRVQFSPSQVTTVPWPLVLEGKSSYRYDIVDSDRGGKFRSLGDELCAWQANHSLAPSHLRETLRRKFAFPSTTAQSALSITAVAWSSITTLRQGTAPN